MGGTVKLPILHFNDVYRVQPQKLPSSKQTVSASQFTQNLKAIRDKWPSSPDRDNVKDGLILFSGDIFSPSLESGVTRGSHMVPVINMIAPDVSLTGNHDFDFGYPHLTKLVGSCTFPWLLSNIVDRDTGKTPASLQKFHVIRRCGLTIGIIGLVEQDWILTVSSWPPNFDFMPMDQVGMELSKELRSSPHNCDLIICLTHSRLPNDIILAKQLGARSNANANDHGVDVLFGGHDHMYYIGRGIQDWEGWDLSRVILGAKDDTDAMLVKSGTDFRDLSEMMLELEDTPPGSVRKKVIKSIQGKRHSTKPDWPQCPDFDAMIRSLLGEVKSSLGKPVCKTLTKWDARSEHVRTEESALGNWMADVLRHAYDDAICIKGRPNGGADGVLICGGTLRGDSTYDPGELTLGDVYEILPFDDPIIMLSLSGADIWDALENGFSTWPSQEGRFPIVAGMRVKWDSRRPPHQRVLSINLSEDGEDGDAIPRSKDRMYAIVSRQYMAEGFDGFDALKGKEYLIDDENGVVMSSLIRKFLLGSQYIHEQKKQPVSDVVHRHPSTDDILNTARAAHKESSKSPQREEEVDHSSEFISNAFHIGGHEHMSAVDVHEGGRMRGDMPSASNDSRSPVRKDLTVVAPRIDGRLTDVGRQ